MSTDEDSPETSVAGSWRVIDLFAGCGGLTAGFATEGFRSVFAVESDSVAASTYAANFGAEHVRARPLGMIDSTELPSAEVVVGGPPCQGFSGLGRRDPADQRNQLWREYLDVIATVRPRVFVLENVDRFARSPAFESMRETLDVELPEYKLDWDVLNAADYGVPQRRRRTVVIASRVGVPELPSPTHAKVPHGELLPWTTVREALQGLPLTPRERLPDIRSQIIDGVTVNGVYDEAAIHVDRTYGELMLCRFDHIPPGGGRFDLPEALQPPCWRRKATGTVDVMGRLEWDAPSLTVRTEFHKPEKGRYLHPQWDGPVRANRTISPAEAARLQTFPPEFRWCGARGRIARQIGNAVPPRLAAAIARAVRSTLEAEVA